MRGIFVGFCLLIWGFLCGWLWVFFVVVVVVRRGMDTVVGLWLVGFFQVELLPFLEFVFILLNMMSPLGLLCFSSKALCAFPEFPL